MPEGVTALTRLTSLSLSMPLVPTRRLPEGFGNLPLTSLVRHPGPAILDAEEPAWISKHLAWVSLPRPVNKLAM